jgi:hypothetical protein
VSSLKGRKATGDAFAAYLASFETVYHMNSQHTVDIQGNTATGTYYLLKPFPFSFDASTTTTTSTCGAATPG